MKRKETSQLRKLYFFFSSTRCWCFMGLPKLFTTWLCRLSPIFSTYYSPSPQSVSSYTHHTGHSILSGLTAVILYEVSAILYPMPMVWVIQKSSYRRRNLAKQFSLERLRAQPLCFLLHLLIDPDAASTFLLECFHKGMLKELNAWGLATGSLKKVMIMSANIWGT